MDWQRYVQQSLQAANLETERQSFPLRLSTSMVSKISPALHKISSVHQMSFPKLSQRTKHSRAP